MLYSSVKIIYHEYKFGELSNTTEKPPCPFHKGQKKTLHLHLYIDCMMYAWNNI